MSENPYKPPEAPSDVTGRRRRWTSGLIAAILILFSIPASGLAFFTVCSVMLSAIGPDSLGFDPDMLILGTSGLSALVVLGIFIGLTIKILRTK